MANPTPPPNIPLVPDAPVGKPVPSPVPPRPGEGFDIPDPFDSPTPIPAAPVNPQPSMPEKSTQPKEMPSPVPPNVPQAASSDSVPAGALSSGFQQPKAPQRSANKGVFLAIGIFIAIILVVAVVFIAYRLLVATSVPPVPVSTPTPLPLVTATPDITALPSNTPEPAPLDSSDVADPDEDGLTNAEERFYGTDPVKADTDGDSYNDSDEVRNGYNPLGEGKLDSDNDGFPDPDERKFGSDPFNPDTDGDGYSDGDEITHGHNPLLPAPNDKL